LKNALPPNQIKG